MQFKDLPIGARFEFDHSRLPVLWTGAIGPWEKLSARTYRHIPEPGISDPSPIRVGTITVDVCQLAREAGS